MVVRLAICHRACGSSKPAEVSLDTWQASRRATDLPSRLQRRPGRGTGGSTTRAGDEVQITGELADVTFSSQADAESWVGEFCADLAELGVDAVTLLEADRTVYGPMSLHPSG